MPTGFERKQRLLELGATPEEVAAWEEDKRAKLTELGATSGEIEAYFGGEPLNFQSVDKLLREGPELPAKTEPAGKDVKAASTLGEAFTAGFQVSVTGLSKRRKLPDLVLGEDPGLLKSVSAAIGTMVGDLPAIIPSSIVGFKVGAPAGGVAGGAATRTPVGAEVGSLVGGLFGAGAVSGFVTAEVRESWIEFLKDNEGREPTAREYAAGLSAKALSQKVLQRAGKEAAIGGIGGLFGGAAGSKVTTPVLREVAIGAGEFAGAVAATSAIEKELPTPTEFGTYAALALGGTIVSTPLGRLSPGETSGTTRMKKDVDGRIKKEYSRTGKRPKQTVEEAELHPVDREDLVTGANLTEDGKTYADSPDGKGAFGGEERLRFDNEAVDAEYVDAGENSWSKYARAARGKRGKGPEAPESTELVPFEGGGGGGKKPPPTDRVAPRPGDPDGPATQADIDAIMGRTKPGKKDRSFDVDDFRFEAIDDLQFAKSFAAQAWKSATGETLPIEKNPGEMLALARGSPFIAEQHITRGVFDRKTGKKVAPSLKEIAKRFKTPEQTEAWKAYMIAKRALEKEAQGRDTGMPMDAARRLARGGDKSAAIQEVTAEYRQWDKAGVEWYADSGMLSKEGLAKILSQNADFVPYHSAAIDRPGGSSFRGIPVRPVMKKFKGGDIEIVDPLESIIKNRFMLLRTAENNRARRRFARWNDTQLPEEFRVMDRITPFYAGEKPPKRPGKGGPIVEDLPDGVLPGQDPGLPQILDFSDEKMARLGKELEKLEFNPENQLVTISERGKAEVVSIEDIVRGDKNLQKFVEANNLDIDDLTWMHVADELEAFAARRGEIVVFEEGRPITYRARDMRLVKSFERLTPAEVGIVVKALSIPSQALRSGITGPLSFVLTAMTRDALDAPLINSFRTVPFVTSFDGIMKSVLRKDVFEQFVANGGSGTALVNMDADVLRRSLLAFQNNKILDDGTSAVLRKSRNAITSGYRVLYANGMLSDQAVRVGRFKTALREGLTPEEAAIQGRLVSLDFAQVGATMSAFNRIVTFLGPVINGVDRAILAANRHPKHLFLMGMTYMTIPTMMLWALNHDQKWYKELTDEEKRRRWYVRVGGTEDDPMLVKLPKPHAWASLFSNTPELILDDVIRDNPNLGESLRKGFLEEFMFDPTAISATEWSKEIAANHDGFFNSPIVSDRLDKNVLPMYRYTPYTSESAKKMSRLLPDIIPKRFRAPEAIDYAINGLTGTRGGELLALADKILNVTGVVDEIPTSRDQFQDSFLVRGFFEEGPRFRRSMDQFYRNVSVARETTGTFKELMKQGKTEEANKILKAYGPLMAQTQQVEVAMGTIFGLIRRVEFSKDMSPAEKQQLVDQYMRLASETAIAFNQVYDQARKRQKELEKQK